MVIRLIPYPLVVPDGDQVADAVFARIRFPDHFVLQPDRLQRRPLRRRDEQVVGRLLGLAGEEERAVAHDGAEGVQAERLARRRRLPLLVGDAAGDGGGLRLQSVPVGEDAAVVSRAAAAAAADLDEGGDGGGGGQGGDGGSAAAEGFQAENVVVVRHSAAGGGGGGGRPRATAGRGFGSALEVQGNPGEAGRWDVHQGILT